VEIRGWQRPFPQVASGPRGHRKRRCRQTCQGTGRLCAASLGTMYHGDIQIRKVNARVDLLQNRVVPFLDLAEENTGQRIGSKRNFTRKSRQIRNRNDCAHNRGQQNILALLAGRYIVNGLAAVRSAKVHIACQKSLNSCLRADWVVCTPARSSAFRLRSENPIRRPPNTGCVRQKGRRR
jgi:hypothetical protein